MWAVISLFFLVLAQNASFTLVSRARNSKSLLYHGLAAIGSNGIWLLVFKNMVVSVNVPILMWTYLVASVLGSIGMHYVAMKWFEKPKSKAQVPTVGRIVNYYNVAGADNVFPSAAMIVHVENETLVSLQVFNDDGRIDYVSNVIRGNNYKQWNWPVIK